MKRAGIVTLLLLVVVAGCVTKGPRQTKLMKSTHMTISAAALRVQVRSLASRFSGLMEEVGEEVLRDETDPMARRNALLWLTNGIPVMQQALFQPDPLAALIDSWFLIAQMRGYFETATEHGMPQPYVDLANKLLDDMEADLKLIIDNAGPSTMCGRGRELI